MKNILPTSGASLREIHPLHRCAPGFPRNHIAVMRAKPDEYNAFLTKLLTCELTNVQHPRASHVCIACVANMSVMGPYNCFGIGTMKIHKALKCFHHV